MKDYHRYLIQNFMFLVAIILFSISINATETVLQNSHKSEINAISFSPDGKYIVSASSDRTIKLWDSNTGLLIRTFVGHEASVNDISFSLTGDTLISAGSDKLIILWNIKTGAKITTYRGSQAPLVSVDIHPKSRQFLTASYDKKISIWDMNITDHFIWHKVMQMTLSFAKYNANGSKFACCGDSPDIYLWESEAIPPSKITTASESVEFLSFCKEAPYFMSCSNDGKVTIWELQTNTIYRSFESSIIKNDVSNNGRYLACVGDDGNEILIYNVHSKEIQKRLHNKNERITCMNFNQDASSLVTGYADGTLIIWDVSSSSEKRSVENKIPSLADITISKNDKFLASAYSDNYFFIWQFGEDFEPKYIETSLSEIIAIAFSNDSKFLAVAGLTLGKEALEIWDFENSKNKKYDVEADELSNVAFSKDDNYVLCQTKDKIKVLALENEKIVKSIDFSEYGKITDFKLGADKKLIFAVGTKDGHILVNSLDNVQNIKEIFKIKSNLSISNVALSVNCDSIFFCNTDNQVFAFNTNSKKQLFSKKYENFAEIKDLGIFGNGKYLNLCIDNDLEILNPQKKFIEETSISNSHEIVLKKSLMTSDSKYIITAGTEGTIKIWEFGNTKAEITLAGFKNGDWVAVSSEGYFDGSQNGITQLNMVEDNKPVRLDSYFNKNFLPGILNIKVPINAETSYYPSLTTIAKLYNPLPIKGISEPPTVRILNPQKNANSIDGSTMLTIEVLPKTNRISEISVYLNGKKVRYESPPFPINNMILRDYSLSFVENINKIKVIATDEYGIESLPEEVTVKFEKKTVSKPDLYILSVGIEKYVNEENQLKLSVKDCEDFTKILDENNQGKVNKIYTYILKNKNATKENLLNTFEKIATLANENDIFVFYFSGHGISIQKGDKSEPEFFLALQNVENFNNYETVVNKGFSTKELSQNLLNIRASKQFIAFDACYSGAASSSLYNQMNLIQSKELAKMTRDIGITAISSSLSGQVSYEDQLLGHGMFTNVLLDGLQGKADTGDKKIYIGELRSYIIQNLPEKSKIYGYIQKPVAWSWGAEFIISYVK